MLQGRSNRVRTDVFSDVGTTVMLCGAVWFYSMFVLPWRKQGELVQRHVFNSATSRQPVAKLVNRYPVAAIIVAPQSVREWRLRLISGEVRCSSTVYRSSLSLWRGVQRDRLLHTRPVSGKKQQMQAALPSPPQHICRGAAGLLPWHSGPLFLQAIVAAAAADVADGGVSSKSLPSQHFV